MKRYLIILLIFYLNISAYGQSVQKIDSLVLLIDRTNFSDTIKVDNNILKCKSVTGYITNDLIKKIELVIDSTKSFIIYFWHYYPDYPEYNTLIYAQEKCVKEVSQYYFCEDTIAIIDSKKFNINESDSISDLCSLFFFYEEQVAKQIIENATKYYNFIGKLVEIPKGISSCGGVMPSGAAFKYEVIETDYKDYISKYVIINIGCPPIYGKDFFNAGSKYKIRAATTSGVSFGISIINYYSEELIPDYWSREIEKIE
jgi:hypothetical protein